MSWTTNSTTGTNNFSPGGTIYYRIHFGPSAPPRPPPPPPRRQQFNAFDVLGVPRGAPWPQVKAAYRRLAKQHHPDLGGEAIEMQKINLAYAAIEGHDAYRRQREGGDYAR